jgi:hypothetical protein
MEILHPTNKGREMDTLENLEKFYIYKITCDNTQINDKNTSKPNAIFDTVIREEATRRLTNQYTPSEALLNSVTVRTGPPDTRNVQPAIYQ